MNRGGQTVRYLHRVLGAGILALALGTLVSGDDKPPKARNYVPPGWKKLNLTAVQREKINTIHAGYKKKIDDLTKQIDALKETRTKEMLAVLTKKQKDQLVGNEEETKDGKSKKSDKDK
jgi:hypothetical protein